jgi:hypothetical protein
VFAAAVAWAEIGSTSRAVTTGELSNEARVGESSSALRFYALAHLRPVLHVTTLAPPISEPTAVPLTFERQTKSLSVHRLSVPVGYSGIMRLLWFVFFGPVKSGSHLDGGYARNAGASRSARHPQFPGDVAGHVADCIEPATHGAVLAVLPVGELHRAQSAPTSYPIS